MRLSPYQLIFILLSFCLLAIVLLQAMWINTFYSEKQDQFRKAVYESLDRLATRLYERNNLQLIQQSIDPAAQVFSFRRSRESASQIKDDSMEIIGAAAEKMMVDVKEMEVNINQKLSIQKGGRRIVMFDTVVDSGKISAGKKQELEKLMRKVFTEIKTLDAGLVEKIPADTLRQIIRRILNSKGINEPFEFALVKNGKKEQTLVRSNGFDSSAVYYEARLSQNRLIDDRNVLRLQFQGEKRHVLRSMGGTLGLSLFFTFVMIAVFYYTLQLILKQKKISDIKNYFMNNMTHEFKTPLATISLAVDALRNPVVKNNQEKFEEYTRILKEENNKLNRHVESVLQLALLDKGHLKMRREQTDLVALMNAAIDHFKLQIREKSAEVIFVQQHSHVFFNADEEHFKAVFHNLIDNALKYCRGKCHIRVNMEQTETQLRISIQDKGIGMDEKEQALVFDKFYRVQGGDLHDIKGFGLGLSYVRSVVEAHGGNIRLNSRKGEGTEFILIF